MNIHSLVIVFLYKNINYYKIIIYSIIIVSIIYNIHYIIIIFFIFSGFNAIKDEMKSWKWQYGRTPKFNITIKLNNQSVILNVKNGIVENISSSCNFNFNDLVNEKFDINIVDEIQLRLKSINI